MLSARYRKESSSNEISISDGFILKHICRFLLPKELAKLTLLNEDWKYFINSQLLEYYKRKIAKFSSLFKYYHGNYGHFIYFDVDKFTDINHSCQSDELPFIQNCIVNGNGLLKYKYMFFWSNDGANYYLLNGTYFSLINQELKVTITTKSENLLIGVSDASFRLFTSKPKAILTIRGIKKHKKEKTLFKQAETTKIQKNLLLFGVLSQNIKMTAGNEDAWDKVNPLVQYRNMHSK